MCFEYLFSEFQRILEPSKYHHHHHQVVTAAFNKIFKNGIGPWQYYLCHQQVGFVSKGGRKLSKNPSDQ